MEFLKQIYSAPKLEMRTAINACPHDFIISFQFLKRSVGALDFRTVENIRNCARNSSDILARHIRSSRSSDVFSHLRPARQQIILLFFLFPSASIAERYSEFFFQCARIFPEIFRHPHGKCTVAAH